MAKSSVQIKCERLLVQIVLLRDKVCQACYKPNPECHHIAFKSQGNWQLQTDPDFGVALCHSCHQESPNAPHVSRSRFRYYMLPLLLSGMKPPRAAKIEAYMAFPRRLGSGVPDYKLIRANLGALVGQYEDDYYFDADIERGYHGRVRT